jgi:hypothetical protein
MRTAGVAGRARLGVPRASRRRRRSTDRYFRTDADIPPAYYDLIVQAGTMCPENKAVSPLLVAAMLKDESGFDPNLADPAADEYGIARWTPGVLKFYLPSGQRDRIPAPPFPPEMSIPAVGRYLCWMAPKLEEIPGSPRRTWPPRTARRRTSCATPAACRGPAEAGDLHRPPAHVPEPVPPGLVGGHTVSRARCSSRTRSNCSASDTSALRCQSAFELSVLSGRLHPQLLAGQVVDVEMDGRPGQPAWTAGRRGDRRSRARWG